MENNTGFRSFVASFAAVKGQRVKVNSSGGIDLAGAANGEAIGVVTRDCQAGDSVAVKLLSAPGTVEVLVTGAVAAGGALYPGASGRLSPVSVGSNTATHRALEAATGAGDIVEVVAITPAN